MALSRLHPTLRITLVVLAAFVTLAFFIQVPASLSRLSSDALASRSAPNMADSSESNPIPGIEVTIKQSCTSPPTVQAKVTNNNKHTVTFVSYSSPVDDVALPLGLLSITPAGASDPLELTIIKFSRMWPPPMDCLIELEPGASKTKDIVIKAPTVPMDKLGKQASVFMEGRWTGVWSRKKDQITKNDVEGMSRTPDVHLGSYKTDKIDIRVD